MQKLLTAFALLAATIAPSHAGGLHATVEGPARDGVTLNPWVCADGLADGKLHSLRLRLEPTATPGVYTFQRTWPHQGDWMLRVNLGDPPPAPATVASVGRDGRVKENQFFWNTYGVEECRKVLQKLARAQGITLDDDC